MTISLSPRCILGTLIAFFALCMSATELPKGDLQTPIGVHLAIGDASTKSHVHLFLNRPGITTVTVQVLGEDSAVVREYEITPSYRGKEQTEAVIILTSDIAEVARSVRLRAFRTTATGAPSLVHEHQKDAIPMAGCSGFCMQFRTDCNYACYGCLVDELTYWCGDVGGGECDGNCECCCDPPAYNCS